MSKYIFFSKPSFPPLTGGDRFHNEVLSGLKQAGNDVSCISLNDAPRFCRNFIVFNLWLVWCLWQQRGITFILDLYYHPWAFLAVWAIKYLYGCKLVISARGIYFIDKGFLIYWLSRCLTYLMLKPAELLVVNSAWTRNELCKRGAGKKKFVVVPPGIDLPKALVRSAAYSPRKRLLSVANCTPVKRLDHLIKAVSRLDKKKYHLTIMGETRDDPVYFKKLVKLVSALGLQDNISFIGFVSGRQKIDQYLRADIFVHSSMAEGYGIALMEAMCLGLPIVACRVGAIPEMIENQRNGLLVAPGSTEKLAQAIKTLINDSELRARLKQNNKNDHIKKAYTWPRVRQAFVANV